MAERGFTIVVDGKYGSKSKSVCQQFQQQVHVAVDGIVGPVTWEASWSK
jgi:peptidoglycan hydrolase-like protein with peptidoglycan-binding domain